MPRVYKYTMKKNRLSKNAEISFVATVCKRASLLVFFGILQPNMPIGSKKNYFYYLTKVSELY